MRELVRTNNAVLITAIEALLKAADIPSMVLDQHMSVLEGSLGMLPRRIVVDEEHLELARQLLEDAGLAHELGYTDQSHLNREFKRYSGTTAASFARKAKTGKEAVSADFVAFVLS